MAETDKPNDVLKAMLASYKSAAKAAEEERRSQPCEQRTWEGFKRLDALNRAVFFLQTANDIQAKTMTDFAARLAGATSIDAPPA